MVAQWRNRGLRVAAAHLVAPSSSSSSSSCPSLCSPNCFSHLCPVFQLPCVLKGPFAAPRSLLTQRGMSNVTGGGSHWSKGATGKILIHLPLYSIFSPAVTVTEKGISAFWSCPDDHKQDSVMPPKLKKKNSLFWSNSLIGIEKFLN